MKLQNDPRATIDPKLLELQHHPPANPHPIQKPGISSLQHDNLGRHTRPGPLPQTVHSTHAESSQPTSLATTPQPRFAIGTEVHILDNYGTERTGLTTFIVISNDGTDPNRNEPTYRLRPDTQTTFRAPESRLLQAGFSMGAEVKQKTNIVPAIVLKRFVAHGKRVYDVKDEFGLTYMGVYEEELEPHSGGDFDFVWKQGV